MKIVWRAEKDGTAFHIFHREVAGSGGGGIGFTDLPITWSGGTSGQSSAPLELILDRPSRLFEVSLTERSAGGYEAEEYRGDRSAPAEPGRMDLL